MAPFSNKAHGRRASQIGRLLLGDGSPLPFWSSPFALSTTVLLITLSFFTPALAEDYPTPVPADPRCLTHPASPETLISVAYPLAFDLSPDGRFEKEAKGLAGVLASDLELSGLFNVLPRHVRPKWWTFLFFDEILFDYLGWWEVGAHLVLVATLAPSSDGQISVDLKAFLPGEGDLLQFRDASAKVSPDRVETLAHRFANALVQCFSGVSGIFGTRIAFSFRRSRKDPKQVYFVEFGSNNMVQVSHDPVMAILPAWGPSGSIVFTGYGHNNADLFIVRCPGCRDAKAEVLSQRPGLNTGAALSPDSRFFAATLMEGDNIDIFLIDAQTGREYARLTQAPSVDTSPTWAPDGSRIAFVSDRLGGPQIFVMDSDGGRQHPLPLPGSYNTSPDWSPDGTAIVYQSRGEGERFAIWRYDIPSGMAVRLTDGRFNDEDPSFSPDGRLIVFSSTRGGARRLYIMDREGRNVRLLNLGPGEFFTPAWERVFRLPR